jgi:hypothetical protein
MPFLALPPELRVKIYRQILHDSEYPYSGALLDSYCGIVLCCKEVNDELLHEWNELWAKIFDAHNVLLTEKVE